MQRKAKVLMGSICLSIAYSVLSIARCAYAAEETLVLETYYPSPYGVYNELRLFPRDDNPSCTTEGVMYYDNSAGQRTLKVCTGSGWQSVASSWGQLGASIYNTNTGNVGIKTGTTSPDSPLVVKSSDSGNAVIKIWDDGWGIDEQRGIGIFGSSIANELGGLYYRYHIGGGSDSGLQLKVTGNVGLMVLDNSGNVGIGSLGGAAALTDTKLQVKDGNDRIAFYRPADNRFAIQTLLDYQPFATYGTYGGDAENRLLLQPLAGYVGIGTTNPISSLHVANNAPIITLQDLNSSGLDSWGSISFKDSAGSNRAIIGSGWGPAGSFTISNFNQAPIHLAYGDTPKMTVLHTGEVGVGTQSPAEKLEVNGTIKLSGASPTYRVTNVADPQASSDVATRAYVDNKTAMTIVSNFIGGTGTATASCPSGKAIINAAARGGTNCGNSGTTAPWNHWYSVGHCIGDPSCSFPSETFNGATGACLVIVCN